MRGMPETPLLTYLRIQRATDRDVLAALRSSAASVDGELRRLQGRVGAGNTMRREQLLHSQAAINREMATLFTRVGKTVEANSAEAAAAGAESILRESESLLRRIVSAEDYDYMLRSVRESAAQSLEALRMRVSGSSYVPLAESVWGTHAAVNGKIGQLVNDALARGASAAELARDVRAYVNPNTPGGVRYAALRLGRTELNNAFHAAQVAQAQDEPWTVAVRWHLSGSHPVPDECNDYAEKVHMDDGEPGLWDPEEVPSKPHPNCLCYTTPETPDVEQFIDQYFDGKYDPYLEDEGVDVPPPVEDQMSVSQIESAYQRLSAPQGPYSNRAVVDWTRGKGEEPTPGDAWGAYVGNAYNVLNVWKRTGTIPEKYASVRPDRLKRLDGLLDEAFDKYSVELADNTTLYRAVHSRKGFDAKDFTPGSEHVERSWMSTGIRESTEYGDTIIEVRVPRGTKVMVGEENELILRPGAKYRTVSNTGDRIVVEVEDFVKTDVVQPLKAVDKVGSSELQARMSKAELQRQELTKAKYVQSGKGKGNYNLETGYDSKSARALTNYTESANVPMNLLKRDPEAFMADEDWGEFWLDSIAQMNDMVEELLKKNAIQEDITVARHMTGKFGDLEEGSYFADPGFLSTTTDLTAFTSAPSAAYQEALAAGAEDWTFIIQAPKGTPALPGADYQKEIVFGPGSKQKILFVDKETRTIYTEFE